MPSARERLTSPILIDGGTTNTRAWSTENGRVIQRFEVQAGLRDVAAGERARFEASLKRLLDDVIASVSGRTGSPPRCLVVAGMIASGPGLGDVPHVSAPAGLQEIARGGRWTRIPWLTELEVLLVPGVRSGAPALTPRSIGGADVMRGEETLCVGLLAGELMAAGGTLLNLGSHWKLVTTDRTGRITGSRTSLTGELVHAAQSRTILAASVPASRPTALDPEWLDAGAAECKAAGLPRALFCVRLLDQRSDGTPEQRLAFLIGAFMAADLDPLLASGVLSTGSVSIAGDPVLSSAVAARLERQGVEARFLTPGEVEEGMTLGLYRILGAAS